MSNCDGFMGFEAPTCDSILQVSRPACLKRLEMPLVFLGVAAWGQHAAALVLQRGGLFHLNKYRVAALKGMPQP